MHTEPAEPPIDDGDAAANPRLAQPLAQMARTGRARRLAWSAVPALVCSPTRGSERRATRERSATLQRVPARSEERPRIAEGRSGRRCLVELRRPLGGADTLVRNGDLPEGCTESRQLAIGALPPASARPSDWAEDSSTAEDSPGGQLRTHSWQLR